MPNLIHFLDAYSLTTLFHEFCITFNEPYFFSIHDCFGTTCDKVETLKTILVSVYTDLYSTDQYLKKFYNSILTTIENVSRHKLNRTERTIYLPNQNKFYHLHYTDWVINKKDMYIEVIEAIDTQ